MALFLFLFFFSCNTKVNLILSDLYTFTLLICTFLHVFQLLNELELHCKFKDHHGYSTTVENFKSNWTEISKKVKIALQTRSLLPDDQELSPGMLSIL